MSHIDKNDRLKENPFSYHVTKASKAIIFYEGRQIKTLNEKETARLFSRIHNKSDFDVQLELAKVTGNFKRGNERMSKR